MASRHITRGDHVTGNRNIGGSSPRTNRPPARDRNQAGLQDDGVLGHGRPDRRDLDRGQHDRGRGRRRRHLRRRQGLAHITILGSAYMVSRGLAKSGSRDPYYEDGTNQARGDDAHESRR